MSFRQCVLGSIATLAILTATASSLIAGSIELEQKPKCTGCHASTLNGTCSATGGGVCVP